MKWFLFRFLAYAPFAFAIIWSQDFAPGWVWGVIVGVCLVAFAIIWQAITIRQVEAQDEREYQQWVKDTDARNDSWNASI